MVQAKELRIGNKVGINLQHFPDNYFTVLEVGNTMKLCEVGREHTQDYFYVADIQPIPLTPDILERCGLVKREAIFRDVFYCKYKHRIVDCEFNIDFDGETALWIEGNTIVEFQYLHQLQNLYYALTHQEIQTNI